MCVLSRLRAEEWKSPLILLQAIKHLSLSKRRPESLAGGHIFYSDEKFPSPIFSNGKMSANGI